MTDSKHSSSVSDLSDRVRARLRNPNYLVNYDQIHENQFGYTPDLFLPKWSIPVRIAVSTLGIVSLVFSTRTKGSVRKGLELFGLSSLIRGITNLHVTDLIGWVANPSVRLRRNIRIQAAIDDVYDFLSHFENYPRFMSYVQKVEVNDQGGLSWTVQGPARINFHWNTSLGRMIRNKVISWQSSDNSLIRNSGDFQLKDLAGEGTELQIELSYAPPVGALGYAVVHYLGFDPKERIDEDLQVLKSLIEKSFSPDVELADFHRA